MGRPNRRRKNIIRMDGGMALKTLEYIISKEERLKPQRKNEYKCTDTLTVRGKCQYGWNNSNRSEQPLGISSLLM